MMADIQLVLPGFREEVLAGLESAKFEIEWLCFENNPAQCLKNSARRVTEQAKDHEGELDLISRLTKGYELPADATVIGVAVPK